MRIIERPSPNFDTRDGHSIDMLVLHYTGMATAAEALSRLCDPAAKVSAHYMVDEDGSITRLVAEDIRAWHAGVSHWRGHSNINQRSVGIEIVNPGHEFGYRPFPQAQMEAVVSLCKNIIAAHPIPARNVVAHSDIAPARKQDPGELFDWSWLAAQGIGLFPMPGKTLAEASKLAEFGYDMGNAAAAITAFQRRFRPGLLSGQWDDECAALLAGLLALL